MFIYCVASACGRLIAMFFASSCSFRGYILVLPFCFISVIVGFVQFLKVPRVPLRILAVTQFTSMLKVQAAYAKSISSFLSV